MTDGRESAQRRYPVFVEDQREFFDELITKDWATYQSTFWELTRQFEISCLFEQVAPRRVIDVGCGCGYHDVLMADRPTVEQVVGVDYSEKSVEVANREYPHPRVQRFVGNIFELESGGYDLAASFQVIEHLTDPVAFLKACARQVRKGGWVAVATPNRLRLQNRMRKFMGLDPVLCDPQHFCEYTMQELASVGIGAGLSIHGGFAYGASLALPKLRWQLIPQTVAVRLGFRWPALADCFCVIYRT